MGISDEKDLYEAVKNKEDYIEIEGDLKEKVLKIKARVKVAWVIAIGGVAAVVLLILTRSNPAAIKTNEKLFKNAIQYLGADIAPSVISIFAIAGSVPAALLFFNSLRDYKIIENTNEKVVLKRK